MTALIVTVSCSDGEPLTDERRDEIRAAFTGAAKRIGMDVQSVHVEGDHPGGYVYRSGDLLAVAKEGARSEFDNKASARTLADRKPHSVTEWHYEQASWDKRHGRV